MVSKIRVLRDTLFPSHRGRTQGILGEFENPHTLVEAAHAVRTEGYRFFDAHSPFPIHGMDRAMGLGSSKLGYIVFGMGITGAALGYLMQWWMGAVDYPMIISGKPFFSIEPSVPIIFELMVLFSALGAVGGMLALNRLPRPHHPLFSSERFASVSDDGFFLHIEARDPRFRPAETGEFLKQLGARHVEILEDPDYAEEATADE